MVKLMITLMAASLLAACTTQPTTRSAADIRRESDYAAAIRNCDQLESAKRATCIEDAKARYGHS
jgi:uncharacterized lipoprotein YajG